VDSGLQQLGAKVDRRWRAIGKLDARTFHRFIDLAEKVNPEDAASPENNGWPDDEFRAIESRFLRDVDAALDRLEDCFDSYLAYLEEEMALGAAVARLGITRAAQRAKRRPRARSRAKMPGRKDEEFSARLEGTR
jgi:hypothetical protein